jgi:hypothetical protein
MMNWKGFEAIPRLPPNASMACSGTALLYYCDYVGCVGGGGMVVIGVSAWSWSVNW